jgi:7-keto-8-aminopelargonate synthetase-like enzyme
VGPYAATSLRGSLAQFARPTGPDILGRTLLYYNWQDVRRQNGLWPYSRSFDTPVRPTARIRTETGTVTEGINFAAQDYLSLAAHPAVHEAIVKALRDYGPVSSGSACLAGNTEASLELEGALAEHLYMDNVTLFPTGWAAGFGTIAGLIREYDHVILDKLAHASLQQGAHAATRNVKRFPHLSCDAAEEIIRDIREKDSGCGILVVTEGLFSMDSDCADIVKLQDICRDYQATLMLDVAHDLGALGPQGTGSLGIQKMLGEVDLVMGAFSKTFATNGGFLAAKTPQVKQFVKYYGGSHTFSAALSPLQIAAARESLRIIRSAEGDSRRASLMDRINSLRQECKARGIDCPGDPSPIVLVPIHSEEVARVASAMLFEKGVIVNLVEYPAVPAGNARFRMQLMADHTPEHVKEAARVIDLTVQEARNLIKAT